MARQCKGTTVTGAACKRPPSRDSDVCLAHDESRKQEHSDISAAGGKARWSGRVSALQGEIRALMRRVDEGELDTDRARTLLAAHRILRDYETDAREAAELDQLQDEIRELRETLDAA